MNSLVLVKILFLENDGAPAPLAYSSVYYYIFFVLAHKMLFKHARFKIPLGRGGACLNPAFVD